MLKQPSYASTIAALLIFIGIICHTTTYAREKIEYIELFKNGKSINNFYKVLMSAHEQPYINISSFSQLIFELPLICNQKTKVCSIKFTNHHTQYWMNIKSGKMGQNKKVIKLNKINQKQIKLKGKTLWLPLNITRQWLPVNMKWNLDDYALHVETTLTTPSEEHKQRLHQLQMQNYQSKSHQQESTSSTLFPQKKIDIQARYRINWNNREFKYNSLGAQFASNIDLFKGSLFGSGSFNIFNSKIDNSPIYWNYTLKEKNHFHLLQFGSTYYNGSLLLPTFNLKYAINFQRLKHIDISKGFIYQGHTMPNTEVNIWHNGILMKIKYSNQSGEFNVNLPNAMPGDTIKLVFYYRDGTHRAQTIKLAPDHASLLKHKQWDVNFQAGQFDQENLLTNQHFLSHAGVRYGLTKDMTIGVQALRFPSKNNEFSAGAIVDWQMFNEVNILAESLSYQTGTDYGLQANITTFTDQLIQLQLQRIQDSSPIHSVARPIIYSTLPFEDLLPNAISYWSAKDVINLKNWQITSEYKSTNNGNLAGVSSIGSINHYLSLQLNGGVAIKTHHKSLLFAQTSAFLNFNPKNLLVLKRNWVHNNSKTMLSYRYQSLEKKGWNFNVGLQAYDNRKVAYLAQVEWKITRSLSANLYIDQSSYYFQISWLGIVAMKPGPSYYENFGTGSIAGTLVAPSLTKGGKPTPVEGAVIQIGSITTKTNKNGHYFATGLPTYTHLPFHIVTSSLDASLIPDSNKINIDLRPGTSVIYNPTLAWSSGLDGTVIHKTDIPKNVKVNILDDRSHQIVNSAPIEDNGFFSIDKLPPGHYTLQLEHAKLAKPVHITIQNNTNWISDVNIIWPD